jgi:hypothetical protein
VAEPLGVSKTTSARHLGRLVRAGVLRLATAAEKGQRRATEYLYTGPSVIGLAEPDREEKSHG